MKLWRPSVDNATASNRKFLYVSFFSLLLFCFLFFSFFVLSRSEPRQIREEMRTRRGKGVLSLVSLYGLCFFFLTTNPRLLFHIMWSPSQRIPPNKYVQMHLLLLENSGIYLCQQLRKIKQNITETKNTGKEKCRLKLGLETSLIGLWFSISGWLFVCVCLFGVFFRCFSFFPGMIHSLENCYSSAW